MLYEKGYVKKLDDAQRSDIQQRFMRGQTIYSIARQFGVTRQTVKYHIRNHRPSSGPPPYRPNGGTNA